MSQASYRRFRLQEKRVTPVDRLPTPVDPGSNLKRLTGVGAFLLAVLFTTGTTGSLGRPLSGITCLCLMFAFLLVYSTGTFCTVGAGSSSGAPRTSRRAGGRLWAVASLSLLFLISAVLVLTHNSAAGLLGLAALVFGLDLVTRRAGTVHRELSTLLLTVILFSLYLLLLDFVPASDRVLNGTARFLSSGTGHMIGRDIHLGATYSGLHIVALFAIFFASALALSQRKKILTVAVFFLSVLAAYVIYIASWSLLVNSSLPKHLGLAAPFMTANDFWVLLFALLLVPTFFLIRSLELKEVAFAPTARDLRRLAPAVVLLLLAVPLLTLQPPGSRKSGDIVFYDHGYLDWSLPDYGRLGLRNSGMFGLLPGYLGQMGYQVRKEDRLTAASLKGAATLVLINLDHKLAPAEKSAIWKFVRDGGSLLAMGDHTGREAIREPFNDLLAGTGIAFNFDSAIPLTDRWQGGGFVLKPHPVFEGIAPEELQVNIGASLTAGIGAKPLLVGRRGFSDRGDVAAVQRGNLGDMKFSNEERLGDMALAAEARHGKGKVLVFGDTTSFQNGVLPSSYRFVDNIFTWLDSAGGGTLHPYRVLFGALLLAASLALLFLGGGSTVSLMAFAGVLAISLLVSSGISGIGAVDHGLPKGDTAVIDVSHLERLNLEPLKGDSIDGLTLNLLRSGYTPLVMKEFSPAMVGNARVLVVVAPAKSFSPDEIESIKKFVNRGGLLLATTGFEEFGGSQSLLAQYGMGIRDLPLGQVKPAAGVSGATLWKAWPVGTGETGRAEVLARAWDYPVIVRNQYGKGAVIVAGDSSFLLNRNLEQVDGYNEGNIVFLKECLGRFKATPLNKQ